MKPKIFVSHSGRQYVHQLLQALQVNGYDFVFFTSFAYKPGSFPFNFVKFLPLKLKNVLEREFRKRSFGPIEENKIKHFPYFEFIRELTDKLFKNKIAEKMLFYRDRVHDRWASKKVSANFQIVIGYEECCVETFRKAKELGITTILDLAQIHYKEIEDISNKFPVFSEIYTNQKLRVKINRIKEEEMALADHILCLSEFAKESLIKHGIPGGKIVVVNLGFDPEKFSPKTSYSLGAKLRLAYSGTITKRKGIDLLLKLKNELPDKIDLTFIGPMADAHQLFENNKGKFAWYPYLEQNEMNGILKENDLFVFPSYLDSWAMVVIEGMACGLPVIVTENTGAKDAVDLNCGYIIPSGDYTSLKETVLSFYNNQAKIPPMGIAARKKAEEYTWANYQQHVQKIFEDIVPTNLQIKKS